MGGDPGTVDVRGGGDISADGSHGIGYVSKDGFLSYDGIEGARLKEIDNPQKDNRSAGCKIADNLFDSKVSKIADAIPPGQGTGNVFIDTATAAYQALCAAWAAIKDSTDICK